MSETAICQACFHAVDHVAPTTEDCTCVVCESCANQFMDTGRCGMCEQVFTSDDDDIAPDWLCGACGAFHDCHCPVTGQEPPWGCECAQDAEDEYEFEGLEDVP